MTSLMPPINPSVSLGHAPSTRSVPALISRVEPQLRRPATVFRHSAQMQTAILVSVIGVAAARRPVLRSGKRGQFASSRLFLCALSDEKDLTVDTLLKKYESDIKALRRACPEMLEEKDDTYVLRFAVEHQGDIAAAIKNLQKVNLWRRRSGKKIIQAAAQAVKDAMADGGWNNEPVLQAAPHSAQISQFITGSQIVIVSMPNGDLCSCIRASAIEDEKLMAAVTVEQMCEFFIYAREVNFTVAEQRTRASGRLVQLVAANDLTGVSKLPADKFQQALTKSSEQATTLYPGFAGTTAIINIPEVARFLLQFLTPLFPGSVQQRLKFAQEPLTQFEDLGEILQEPGRGTFIAELQTILKQ